MVAKGGDELEAGRVIQRCIFYFFFFMYVYNFSCRKSEVEIKLLILTKIIYKLLENNK